MPTAIAKFGGPIAARLQAALSWNRKRRRRRAAAVAATFMPQTVSIATDGSTESLQSASAALAIANTWTIAGWMKRTDADTSSRTFVQIGPSLGANSIVIYRSPDFLSPLRVICSSSASAIIKDYSYILVLTPSVWHHVAVTWNGTAMNVYVGGTIATPTSMAVNATGTMTSTARQIAFPDTWMGNRHSFAIWNSVLSPATIATIHAAGRFVNLNAITPAPLHWYRLGANAFDIGADYSGARPLALTNVDVTNIVADAP